jgi:multidrug efflux system membrane fusion protein
MNKTRYAVGGVILLVIIGGAVKYFMPSGAAGTASVAPASVPATTVKVRKQTMPIILSGVGNVLPLASVTVRTRVDGQLDKVNFTEGQDVKAGQVLAQLDARTFEAQLAQVVAQKARDEAQLGNAKLDLQRYEMLIKEDAATQQQLDTQKALVNQLTAAVESDKAQIKYAKVQLDFTTIAAPLSGRIGARLVDPGNIVHATDANGLVVINQVDPIAVVFTLPESAFQDIDRAMAHGHQLAVYAYARDSDEILSKGALVLLNNQIDTATGTVQLKARFANPSHKLWPGAYVNVTLQLGTRENALTVPAPAVQRSQTGTYVYVVKADESVEIRPVTIIQIQDGKAVIGQGLGADERVVLDGQYKLKPGIHIIEKSVGAAQPAKTGKTK